MTTEDRCPLCNRPRPRGALKCACNYVFEYVASPARSPRTTPGIASTLVAVAIAAGVVAFLAMPREPDHEGPAAIMIGGGLFSLAGALANWSWFFGSFRARLPVLLLGRTGARGFYALIGGGLVGAGIALLLT